MKNARTSSSPSILARVLCSVTWVIITCWLGIVHVAIVFFSSYTLPIVGFTIWGIGCAILYGLLLWWTGRAYPAWKSWIFGLILQFCLVALSMVRAYFMADGLAYLFRPSGLLMPFAFYPNEDLLSFILGYGIAFAEIAALQALAIRLGQFFAKRRVQKHKNAPSEETVPPPRRDEW